MGRGCWETQKPPQVAKSTEADDIKIAKAYRTISYDASCVMAGVPPIAIVIAEKAQLYKANTAWRELRSNTTCLYRSQIGHTLLGEQT